MYHNKRYLQFNDLVFDSYDMISETNETTAIKGNSTAYSYTHGSYRPLKGRTILLQEGSVTMTLTLYTKKVPCEYREFYIRFAEQELLKAGKLWAVKNNEIIWAYAVIRNMHEITRNEQNKVEWDIEFSLPEGVWHKADKQRTFALPYNACALMECKNYKKVNPCDPLGDCCKVCLDNQYEESERCCCCVDVITKDMLLCYHMDEIQKFYSCDTPFQLVYDCKLGDKYNSNRFFGQKLCTQDICDSNVIAGRFYSETDIETDGVRLVIYGTMYNPWITINGNTNIIEGEYEGALIIEPSGDVYYQPNEHCEPTLLDPSVWVIPSGMNYGWTIKPQNNTIIVNLNRCCNGYTCVYIDVDSITA